jgi:hypothetical protein
MAYTIHITQDADAAGAHFSDVTLEELAADIGAGADFEAALFAALAALPTADPEVDGAFWLNSGVVTISAGA